MKKYDVAVIGGGPAGYYAAERAADAGLKVLVTEKGQLGGVCLNEGCIPTKTLLYSGKTLTAIKEGEDRGVKTENVIFSQAAAVAKKKQVINSLVQGVTGTLRKKKVDVAKGFADVVKEDGGFSVKVGEETFWAKQILIATGSTPAIPPIPGLKEGMESGNVLTSRELLDIEEIPEKLMIVGAGVIGLEMAEYFSTVGSKVTIVEMMNTVGGNLDKDAAKVLRKHLEKKQVEIYLECGLKEVKGNNAVCSIGGKETVFEFDKMLVCTGRRPSVKGVEKLGIETDRRGAVITDERCMTNVAGIYAIGDVNGKYMLAHVAYREADVAVNNICGVKDSIDYSAVPNVIYTALEVASTGMTSEQAAAAGYNIEVKMASINNSGRHLAEHGISEGFCKMVIDKKTDTLLGAVLVSSYASEIIYVLSLIVQNRIPMQSIRKTYFPHPTVCEIIRDTLIS
jgi:dihydrolipoamide dehydrogenase